VFAPLVASNKVRVIGVVSGEKRSPLMPDVLTLAEQGYELDFRNWFALYFPKDTPAEPVQRWNTEVNKLLADRAFTDKYFVPNSVTPTGGTPAELAAIARVSRQHGEELVKLAKLRFD
jgi:tripartite-type tricarboxylate transporter receptor subunit TctC